MLEGDWSQGPLQCRSE